MKILIDKNIPYIEHFFQDYLDDIEYFTDQDFDISKVAEASIVITRSTYKTHGKKISNAVKFLCSASTGEDHVDKKALDKMNIPYAFSTGANAVAVREYVFSVAALLLKEKKIDKSSSTLIIGCGNIGKGVFEALKYFNFNVSSYDPFKPSTIAMTLLKDMNLSLCMFLLQRLQNQNILQKVFFALRNLNTV